MHLCAAEIDGINFNRDIRPILSNKCFQCHGPSEQEAGLRLDVFDDVTRIAIAPGKPAESLLVTRILTDDPDDVMPPPGSHKKLTDVEKRTLVAWVQSGAEYRKHWSFLPVQAQPDETIDSLVERQLSARGKQRLARADRRTLIRRLSLDLTGLPPTREEIAEFLADASPSAYESVVDRLLASARYGEHMAKYWLDLVRYGDSHGIHADNYREMYFYRDWVIRSFNANLPFDKFIVDQIAGDLQPSPSTEQLIASGFNRLHISNSAGSALQAELYVNNVIDRVNAIGTVYLGLTLACAACHDHKYDPISQREYYQLFAFFNNLDGPPDNKGHKSPEPRLLLPTKRQAAAEKALREQISNVKDEQSGKALRKRLQALLAQVPSTLIMKEKAKPRPAYLLVRGDYDNRGMQVKRQTPRALPAMADDLPLDRFGFAKWLIDPANPLTARVAVNRFWQQLFGVGLVKTSEDFGSRGEWPSHPELLDHLAHTLVQSGWDVKATIRNIVLSETYQQRSDAGATAYATDPENRQLARGPRFRLDAEVLRDQALYVSGQLNETMYGRSVKPPQPDGLWKSVSLPGTSRPDRFTPDTGPDTVRRSVYTYWKRAYPPPAMTIFNAPNRETCVARRERTNTPLQALVLMNEEQFFQSAKQLASLTLSKNGTDVSRMNWAFERLTARTCTSEELALLVHALNDFRAIGTEHHAWTMVMNALLNLDIVKTKS